MLIKVFRSNQPMVLAALPPVIAVIWTVVFWSVPPGDIQGSLAVFDHYQFAFSGWSALLLGGVSVFIEAWLLNGLMNKGEFLPKETYIPALLYVALCPLDPEFMLFSGFHVFLMAWLTSSYLLINMRRELPALEACYLYGVLVGFGSLFYMPGVAMLLASWIYLTQIRPTKWREYLGQLIGVATVGVFAGAFNLFTRHNIDLDLWMQPIEKPWVKLGDDLLFKVLFVLGLSVAALFSIPTLLSFYRKNTIRYKKVTRSFFMQWLMAIGGMVILGLMNREHFFCQPLIVIGALILPFWLHSKRYKRLKEAILLAMLGGLLGPYLL